MFHPTNRQWLVIWAATFVFFAVAGWSKWPALFQTSDERTAYYRDKWAVELKAAPKSQTAFDIMMATADHMGQADKDIRDVRWLAALAGASGLSLAIWQVRGRGSR